MWYLKYKFAHKDCIYAPMLRKYKLNVLFHPMNHYKKGNYIYANSLQEVFGDKKNIKKYINYLKKHPKIVKLESYDNIIISLAKHKTKFKMYEFAYNPKLIHISPAYQDKEGYEIFEIGCWDKKPLQDHINALKNNKTTTYFKILKFIEKNIDNIYTIRLLPKLSEKQKQAIELAFAEGYYKFPKKTNMDK